MIFGRLIYMGLEARNSVFVGLRTTFVIRLLESIICRLDTSKFEFSS